MMGMVGNVEASLPYVMRNQRLFELGQAKQCEFTQQPAMQQAAPESPQ
jgi:hypothetical protein